MTDSTVNEPPPLKPASKDRAQHASDAVKNGLKRRYAAEARFKAYGIPRAIALALTVVGILFGTIISNGLPAFYRNNVLELEIELSEDVIDPSKERVIQALWRAPIIEKSYLMHSLQNSLT